MFDYARIFALGPSSCITDIRIAMNSIELSKIAKKNGFKTEEAKNIKDALKKVSTKEKSLIVIFGSLYLVGHALSLN